MYLNILALSISIGLITIVGIKYFEWHRYAKDAYNFLMVLFLVASVIECLTLLVALLLEIYTFEIFWATFSVFEVSKWMIFAYSVFFIEG